jgi:Ubiquitin carboxyl-terminal hydrolase
MLSALRTLLTFGLLRKTHCVKGCQTKNLRGSAIAREKMGRCHLLAGLPKGKTHKTFQEALSSSLIEFNDSFCQNCKKVTRQRTSQEFVQLPKLFFTMLNRNTEDATNAKIETDCPLPTSFVPVVDQNCKQKNSKYRIAGVVAHRGAHGNSGHNISYVPNHEEPGEWYMINDKTVTRIRFKDVNKFLPNRKAAQQLPYIIAWELMDASSETADEKNEREAVKGNDQEQCMQHLEEKAKALNAREKELKEKEKAIMEKLKKLNYDFAEKDKRQIEEAIASYRRQEQALNQRKQIIEKRDKDVQARREVDEPLHTSSKDNATSSQQPEADAKGQIEQEVDQRRNTATFFATFRNNQNHEENARAIFKLNNFNPDAPTKIESTIQLSDLQGNLRSIKRGTAVTDDFTITFNVKGAKKRKRDEGDDDDEAGPPPPPENRGKRPNRQGGKPPKSPIEEAQKSPSGKHGSQGSRNIKKESQDKSIPLKQEPQTSTWVKKEPSSLNVPPSSPGRSPPKKAPPPPRRSTCADKGKK